MKKVFGVTVLSLILATFASTASGQAKTDSDKIPDRLMELETAISIGGPAVLIFTGYDDKIATPFALALDFRLGINKWSFTRLELNAVFIHGIGANLILDLIRIGHRVKIHLVDPGVFWILPKASQGLSVRNIPRKYDWTFGGGIDVRLNKNFGIGFTWRAFIPELDGHYGSYAKVIRSEARKGGQFWLRFISHSW